MKKILRHDKDQLIDGPMGELLPSDPAFYDHTLDNTNIQEDFHAIPFTNNDSRNTGSFSNSETRN